MPRITVARELAAGTLVQIPVKGLSVPRETQMVFRDQGYLSDSSREFVELMKVFAAPRGRGRVTAA